MKKKTNKTGILASIVLMAAFLALAMPMNVVGEGLSPVAIANPDYQEVLVDEYAFFSGNQSYDPDGTIVSYEWDFGDGNTDTGVFASHAYTSTGEYTVTLTVTDNDGGTDSDIVLVDVSEAQPNQPPVADADPDYQEVKKRKTASFDGYQSFDVDGTIVSYEWDFGDGDTGSGISVDHKYTSRGYYTVTLTITDDDGATDTDTCLVRVK